MHDGLSLQELIRKLCNTTESRSNFKELITVLARIAACTPHSADVERTISADRRLKSRLRMGMCLETENKCMFVHYNMPDLADWNPAAATQLFMSEKNRRDRDITSAAGSKSRAQEYFKGVYPEARHSFDPDAENKTDDMNVESNKYFNF